MSIERPRVSTLGLAALQMSVVVVVSLLLVSTSAQSADSDKAVMQLLRKSLQIPPAVKWPEDGEPCSWQHVTCDYSGRVTRIQLGNQGLSGSLPLSINNLTKLEVLEFMSNNLTGPLPSLSGLSSLQRLYLHNNGFDSIPKDFFKGLSSLQEVFLDYNPFSSWTLPDELQDAVSLMKFSANSANVIGTIPDFFNSSIFPSLTHLHLSNNQLQGSLPSGFSSLGLQSLWLNGQKDQGGARILSGTIEFLQNMTQLVQIWLNMNSFIGPIPDLSGLSSLQDLNLRDNTLTGPVPPSLTKLTSLKVVNLTNNALQGPTPKFPASVAADMLPGQNSFCTPDPGVDCDTSVNALISVLEPFGYPFKLASRWRGNNPCNSWDGITCLNDNITTINFRNMNLSGTISPSFASLTSVQTLYLAHNNITGPIPDALAKMPNLKTLDLSDNRLCGPLPKFKNNTSVNVGNNADINKQCQGPSGGSGAGGSEVGGKDSKTGKVVGAVIGSICALLGACLFLFCFVKRQWRYGRVNQSNSIVIHPNHLDSNDAVKITIAGHGVNDNAASEGYSQGSSGPTDVHVIETNNMVISIQVLRSVTNNFSEDNVLGKGGFGTVYRGELPDGTEIAVKRMNSAVLGDTGLAEFKSEIAVLSKVRHRHLVSLLGFCLDGNEKILVFEYLPRGDLSMHLFSWKEEGLKPLEWKQRLTIALDVARGVEYLHGLAHQSFIHRDLKPSNILLGDDMRAKVADFGLVRLAPNDGKASIQTKLAGTFGYLAPEYAVLGRVTTKVDVFSFGVILMEIITGRKALIESQSEDSVHLVAWFRMMCANKDTFERAIDPAIELDKETLASISTVSELAGHCCAREPSQRPDMGHVVNVLSSLTDIWKPAVENSEDDLFAIDLRMTLPEALKKWQMLEDSIDSSASSFIRSGESSQASIPPGPSGFAASFTSSDGR